MMPILGTTRRMRDCKCLKCGYRFDAAAGVEHDDEPWAGAFTVCMSCGHVMVFTKKLTVRAPTRAEAAEAADDPGVFAAQRAIHELRKHDRPKSH